MRVANVKRVASRIPKLATFLTLKIVSMGPKLLIFLDLAFLKRVASRCEARIKASVLGIATRVQSKFKPKIPEVLKVNIRKEDDRRNGFEAAMQMIKDRLEHRTSHGYRNRFLIMSSILATWDAELVDSDGMLILPAPSDEVLSFFGLLLRNKLGQVLEEMREKQLEAGENDSESNSDESARESSDAEAAPATGRKRAGKCRKGKPKKKPKKKKKKKSVSDKKMNEWKSVSDVQSYKSALKWWYVENKVEFDVSLDKQLDRFMLGYKKKVSDLKQKGEMDLFEGKQHLAFEGYKMLAEKFFLSTPIEETGKGNHKQGSWGQFIFGWVYVVLSWNLIARSVETGRIMLAHISWVNDALTIATPKHKGMLRMADFCGEMAVAHLYANPFNPFICPVLAIAILIFSTTHGENTRYLKLFEGTDTESRFAKILHTMLRSLPVSLVARLGAKIVDIATHSFKKGAVTFALSLPGGPTVVQVYKRAKWTLGFKDRYIAAGEQGDHMTGRVLGLGELNERFSALCPHFTSAGLEILTDDVWARLLFAALQHLCCVPIVV